MCKPYGHANSCLSTPSFKSTNTLCTRRRMEHNRPVATSLVVRNLQDKSSLFSQQHSGPFVRSKIGMNIDDVSLLCDCPPKHNISNSSSKNKRINKNKMFMFDESLKA
ncbi:hypothetical protein PHYBLDRAFT_186451 [Phycomyces blakesleeanus NRRL 1555(-)]|uniref:Uncharacterized protein n=1 Tax=Phycomyces blakesleeanus (strain ATCC 8743b / DSM 1359 / FGSC 10004 / NBRC 33097 / NRRL 1555) TaxID=763407 RepID=A0A163AT74_PHYB8|nr:hypothetical protein PHYBLDRAFT_186451 [Phycomyces blakesleeanus NRRL 1555(-)]OAD75621.1 hypothetical protein PHYBLDRAFT_186451 [Phycomyces blakesleeanus NRRL 1555(-)]|eukprot:XP_018293661.1 hypothetical protein PHYBLDRAFT_186451 [Phycomyces blakesleeanus NRRL 1555(-)]